MKHKKFFKKTQVNIAMEEEQYRWLLEHSIRMTVMEKEHVGLCDVIRRALDQCYPMPTKREVEQTEFFK